MATIAIISLASVIHNKIGKADATILQLITSDTDQTTETCLTDSDDELSLELESNKLRQSIEQNILGETFKQSKVNSLLNSYQTVRTKLNSLNEQAKSDGEQKPGIDQSNCGTTDRCPNVEIKCVPDDGMPGAGFCPFDKCTIVMKQSICDNLGLKDGDKKSTGDIDKCKDDPKSCIKVQPVTWQSIKDVCSIVHEAVHARDDTSVCPNCGSEKNGYKAGSDCVAKAKEEFCPKTVPCDKFDEYINKESEMQNYQQCLCNNLVPGTKDTYESGTCKRCKNNLPHWPPNLIDNTDRLYCKGHEL